MTYAVTLVKSNPKVRQKTQQLFQSLSQGTKFRKRTGVEIKQVFVSFGWPDFILLLEGNNVELLKKAIVDLRASAGAGGDEIETSTIICTTEKEIDKKNKEWARKLLKVPQRV